VASTVTVIGAATVREWSVPLCSELSATRYFASTINVGTTPAAVVKPDLDVESQLEQPCTLPR